MSQFSELVDVGLEILKSDFYNKNRSKILSCKPISLANEFRDYNGILRTSELLTSAYLDGIFNFGCSGIGYIRMHPAYVKFAVKEDISHDAARQCSLTGSLTTYGALFDGPFICVTQSDEMHFATNKVQDSLDRENQFVAVYSRMYEDISEDNPSGYVHPIKAMARRCLTYMPMSPVTALCDLSFLFELCRIWEFSIQELTARIDVAIQKKLEDIECRVRVDCSNIVRHKSKLVFDRVKYTRYLPQIYVPFPGVIVCLTGLPVLKAEYFHEVLMPPRLFEWADDQFAAYDTSEKVAKFRERGANLIPANSL